MAIGQSIGQSVNRSIGRSVDRSNIVKVIFSKKHNIAESITSFYTSEIIFLSTLFSLNLITEKYNKKYISNAFNLFSITIFDIIENITLKQKRPNLPKNR